MPRKTRPRKVVEPPKFKAYKPVCLENENNECIELFYEEYEALKLADYDNMNHCDAAKLMDISRPTFARIYEAARRKIAKALVECKEIKAVYGNAIFDKNWFQCTLCKTRFSQPEGLELLECPICKAKEIAKM
ncbi:MAG: DUF134 domain-containing protein [Bacteroidales bacterium]|nr:DUF134 domain-containing protein [Bacteroidales bacterium]